MNKNISERIDFLPTHCAIKDVLSHESAERNLAFYLNLFNYLIPAFKSVDTEAKENLAFGGYLYFRFLLLFDNFLDSDEKNSLKMAHSLSILNKQSKLNFSVNDIKFSVNDIN